MAQKKPLTHAQFYALCFANDYEHSVPAADLRGFAKRATIDPLIKRGLLVIEYSPAHRCEIARVTGDGITAIADASEKDYARYCGQMGYRPGEAPGDAEADEDDEDDE